MKLNIAGLEKFHELNPQVDMLHFDFLNPKNKGKVNWNGIDEAATRHTLMQYQRLLRVAPDASVASTLLNRGFTSAQAIAARPEQLFVADLRDAFNGDETLLRDIHRRSVLTKIRVQHLWANFKDTVGSPAYKNTKFATVSPDVEEYLTSIPSYQDFFGSLTYCACEECRSIFGPAAYFVDIMRVTAEYITKPNPTIPAGYKLQDRRPDLWSIELTCENTNTLIPYLQLVNELLANIIAGDSYYALATSRYPFNLPFNLPLIQTRTYLKQMKSTLWIAYQKFQAPVGSATTVPLPTPFQTAREYLGLAPAQYTIVSTANPDPESLSTYYNVPRGRLLPFQASGTVSITTNTAVTGEATKFMTEIQVGDFVQVNGVSRAAESIQSDTLLTVDVAWTGTANNATMTVYPYDSLVQVESFLYHTMLVYDDIKALLFQGLVADEINAGIPAQFFINQTNPAFLNLAIDSTDPDAPVQRIVNETYDNLDRLNRFIRFSKISGLGFADLNWSFQGQATIDQQLSQDVAGIKQVADEFRLGIDEVTALYANIKTIGVVDPYNPQDLFDRLFNKFSILEQGMAVYHPLYAANPLYKDAVINWVVESGTAGDPTVRNRLLSAFGLVDNDLTMIGQQALKVLSITNGTLPLTVENLSLLYSYAKVPSLFGLTVSQYLVLLELAGTPRLTTIAAVKSSIELGRWIAKSRLNVFALQYVITGTSSQYYKVGYDGSQLYIFLQTLWALAANWLIGATSFVYENITPEESAGYASKLTAAGFLSPFGVVLDEAIDFSSVSFVDPVYPTNFVTPEITPEESAQTFDLLCQHGVLLLQPGAPTKAYLSSSFTSDTSLSYLFPNDTPGVKEMKIGEVRAILLNIRGEIQHIVDTLMVYGRAQNNETQKPPRGLQEQNLVEQLALFFGANSETMLRLARFAAAGVGMPNYVAQFLQPPPATPSEISQQIKDFMVVVSRCLIVVAQLKLTPDEITAIATHPEYFNITSLAVLTLQDIKNLYTFSELERAFKDVDNELIEYFNTPLSGPCADSAKFQILANLTRWDLQQICQLVSVLWGTSTGYNTVLGVQAMKHCFDLAAVLGVDISALLNLIQLAGLGAITDQSWLTYKNTADSWLNILQAKYTAEEWVEVYEPTLNSLNEKSRDALAGRAITTLQGRNIAVANLSGLYDYLLIDVEMSGCAKTSYIRQGLSSVQLYMQRCRLNLEPSVEVLLVPEVWWEWLSGYRLWEANRKVFLYPENYLDPSLRKDKTALYDGIQDALVSSEITEDRVYDAYLEYFDQLTLLSAVQNVGSYYCPVTNVNTGLTYETLFFFARTPVKPYTYYYRSYANNIWSQWEKINITIKSPYVTPIYIFDKLFIFWSEMDTVSISTVADSKSNEFQDTRTTIKFSFYNYSKEWVQPQSAWEVVTDFKPCSYSTSLIDPNRFDLNQLMYNQPNLIQLPSTTPSDARILLLYSYYYQMRGDPLPPPPTYFVNNDEKDMVAQVYKSTVRAINSSDSGLVGLTFLDSGVVINHNLNASLTNVNLLDYGTIAGSPQPYALTISLPADNPATLDAYLVDNVFLQLLAGQTASMELGMLSFPIYNDALVTAADPISISLLYSVSKTNAYQFNVSNQPGWFVFNNGDETFLIKSQEAGLKMLTEITLVKSNLSGQKDETDLMSKAYTSNPQPFPNIQYQFNRLTTGAITRLSQNLFTGGVSSLLSVESQETPANPLYPFSRFYNNGVRPPNTLPPPIPDGDTIDYDGPYGTYFWEVYYYIPFLIGNLSMANQRHSHAKKWYEYIFNPTATYDPALGNDSYWEFLKLRGITMESLQQTLTNPAQIAVYNNDPYDPNAIARLRPSAFQKAIVMRYIDNIIKWGDLLYTKDTWESINEATLLYMLARDLLGERPVKVGVCKQEPPATFAEIQQKYGDNIPQFLITLENALPAISDGSTLDGVSGGGMTTGVSNGYVPFNDLNSYFCVGINEQLVAYWDVTEDRLFKIRHCMNIQGAVRQLALFEPPINPMDLVRAAAAGRDILSVANQWQPTSSPYRFVFLIAQAKAVAGQLMQFGGQLLGALEKMDAEALAQLRQGQEIEILNLTTKVREKQIEQLDCAISSLEYSRESADTRNRFYQRLIDMGLSPSEQLNISAMILANVFNMGGSLMRGLSSVSYLVPNVGSPFAMTYGGSQIGSSLGAAAAVFDMFSTYYNMISSLSLTMAGYERRAQEWELQLELSAQDIEQIQAQIDATKVQREVAVRELEINERTLEQSMEVEEFLQNKFTNAELYQWMVNRISTVYFQTYRLAVETALAAETAVQYEMNTYDTFITLNYWDSLKKGLLAGEQLMLNLNQLEQAYITDNVRTLEIQKTISMLQTNPKALLDLKETGGCAFTMSESLFDYDFPGQYCRKIKSISITVPALVGPYQNVKATLTQTGSQILIEPDLDGVAFLLSSSGSTTPPKGALRSNWHANQKIAISRSIDDNGMFQLNFNDDRYLPFEGTGAVSRWEFSMPKQTNRFNFSNISDLVIKLSYTALAGAEEFKAGVIDLLEQQPYVGYVAFNFAVQFPSQWYAFMNPPSEALSQEFSFTMLATYFPYGMNLENVSSIYLQLSLSPDTQLGGTLSTMLKVGTQAPIAADFANKTSCNLANLNIQNFVDQPWSILVDKAGIPPGLKDPTTEFLDSHKLLSIGMIITYDGSLDWSVPATV